MKCACTVLEQNGVLLRVDYCLENGQQCFRTLCMYGGNLRAAAVMEFDRPFAYLL